MEQLLVGRKFKLERRITPEVTADRYGNKGVEVFATPALIALLEETAIQCIFPTLNPGQGSVGTRVDVQHLAATPLGMTVTAHAEVAEIDGQRVQFRVEAYDDREQIATGTHERFIVNSIEKFLARALDKAKGEGG